MQKRPNPQGKGLVPLLEALAHSRAVSPLFAKSLEQISNELFTSLFILKSHFQFRPVVGRSYWLYRKEPGFFLSLISPDEWSVSPLRQCIGECILQNDLTWTLNMTPVATTDPVFNQYIQQQREEFEQTLRCARHLQQVLPVYRAELAYYSRVFAAALAHSLHTSMRLGGIAGLSWSEARHLPSPGGIECSTDS